jgi:hypothetical protein
MTDPPRDCFICHASEDKDVARPLAEALIERGYEVWFDEYEMVVGDSLRQKIDAGLANSRFGVVVLSERFFEKEWPARELDGLVSKEIVGKERLILPVWHEIDEAFLVKVSPPLADRVGVPSDPVDVAVEKITQAIERRRGLGASAAAIVNAGEPTTAPRPVMERPEPLALFETEQRVRLRYNEDELRRFEQEGGDPRGPGWMSLVVGPVRLQQDLLDPTEINPDDFRNLDVPGRWNTDQPPLAHYYLQPTIEGFYSQLPPSEGSLPAYAVKIWDDGLMEFGMDQIPALSSGDPARDRMIPSHAVAVYLHDFALLFLEILKHVGYEGEVVAMVAFSGVEGHALAVQQGRYFPTIHPLTLDQVAGRPLQGLVRELSDDVGRWVKKTMDRLFLAAGIPTGAYFIDREGRLLNDDGTVAAG